MLQTTVLSFELWLKKTSNSKSVGMAAALAYSELWCVKFNL
jgi:hypothetical protein